MLRRAFLRWAAGVSLYSAAPAQSADPRPEQGENKRIQMLIRELGNKRFRTREHATAELRKVGTPALPALRVAAVSGRDLEIRTRAQGLVEVICQDAGLGNACLARTPYQIKALAFSHDGRRAAFAGQGGDGYDVGVCETTTGHEVCALGRGTGGVRAVAFSHDDVVTGDHNTTVSVWDIRRRLRVRQFRGHKDFVKSVAVAPDDGMVLSGSWDGRAFVWDMTTGKRIATFDAGGEDRAEGKPYGVTGVGFQPHGESVLCCAGPFVHIWKPRTGKEVRCMRAEQDEIRSSAFLPDGRRVVSAGVDGILRVHEVASGQEVWHAGARLAPKDRGLFGTSQFSAANAVSVSPDGRYIISGHDDCSVRIWQARSGAQLRSTTLHLRPVNAVACSPDGKYGISGGDDGVLWRWPLLLDRPATPGHRH